MTPNDIDIEHLAQEYARQEAATPPPSAWQKIEDNISAAPVVEAKKRISPWQGIVIGTILIAAAMLWQFSRPEEENATAIAAQPTQYIAPQPVAETEAMPAKPATIETKQSTPPTKEAARIAQHEHSTTAPADKHALIAVAAPIAPTQQQGETHSEKEIFVENDMVPNHTAEVAIDLEPLIAPSPTKEIVTPTEETPVSVTQEEHLPLHKEKTDLFIPNLLTPNGDGINDYWVIPALQDCEDVQVAIFTAQGNRVYSNNHYHGEFSGSHLEEGTYYYQVVVKSAQIQRRGVLVIRR